MIALPPLVSLTVAAAAPLTATVPLVWAWASGATRTSSPRTTAQETNLPLSLCLFMNLSFCSLHNPDLLTVLVHLIPFWCTDLILRPSAFSLGTFLFQREPAKAQRDSSRYRCPVLEHMLGDETAGPNSTRGQVPSKQYYRTWEWWRLNSISNSKNDI